MKDWIAAFSAFVLLLCHTTVTESQVYLMNNQSVSACSGTFADSGGPSGPYATQETFLKTFCSDNPGLSRVRLDFKSIAIHPTHELCVYDGPDATWPKLACAADYGPSQPFTVQATDANPSGCLTVVFRSDNNPPGAGWVADISCHVVCQSVLASIAQTLPTAVPADTGWIDICPGDRVRFWGQGAYPQSGTGYPQSDQTSHFEWGFGDGGVGQGQETAHTYMQSGAYYAHLFIRDAMGCVSPAPAVLRVRVAPKPQFESLLIPPPTVCVSDTIRLKGAVTPSYDAHVSARSRSEKFMLGGFRADSLAIPDGIGIPYQSMLAISAFAPGQTLSNSMMLREVRINMEHSWARDLEIRLSCPNGKSVVLHQFAGQTGAKVALGIPNENDSFNPIPGKGFDYAWAATAANPSWIAYANMFLPLGGTLPAGAYAPFQPYTQLMDCPLNGIWTLTATDYWPLDNGFVFSWGLEFEADLFPPEERFEPALTLGQWQAHPSIVNHQITAIEAIAQSAGPQIFRFEVLDAFGCRWDSAVQIRALPPTHPDCLRCPKEFSPLPDLDLCAGEEHLVGPYLPADPLPEMLAFAAPNPTPFPARSHPAPSPFFSDIIVSHVGYDWLSAPVDQMESVCVELETPNTQGLRLRLLSPDGKVLLLSNQNGSAGANYLQTCFSPDAIQPIGGAAPPFWGDYMPQGSWNALDYAWINGAWRLEISDASGQDYTGLLKNWSLTFRANTGFYHNWSPKPGLSCYTCDGPKLTATQSDQYWVIAANAFGCQAKDTFSVNVWQSLAPPGNLVAYPDGTGGINWIWDPVPGAANYEVSLDGVFWSFNGPNLNCMINGYAAGDTARIWVRAYEQGSVCEQGVSEGIYVFSVPACGLEIQLSGVQDALCHGSTTGSAFIDVVSGAVPVIFLPDGMFPASPTGDFVQFFAAGTHFVVAIDANGCRDTVTFSIGQPPPIQINASATNATCAGASNGSVMAGASGGLGMLQIAWQNCAGGPVLPGAMQSGLPAGCYRATVTDDNSCTATAVVTIQEPPPITASVTTQPSNCFGAAIGAASVTASGGVPGYTFTWANGQTGPNAQNLPAGPISVVVRDQNGCEITASGIVSQSGALIADSITTVAATCAYSADGMAQVFVSGGMPPYDYVWSDNQTTGPVLTAGAGLYQVSVTDAAQCSAIFQVLIGSPPALQISLSLNTEITCAGDCNASLQAQASGGSGSYQYAWDPGVNANGPLATALCAGVYGVTVTDTAACTAVASFVVFDATPVQVVVNATPPTCFDSQNGTAQAVASGGAGGYQYLWSSGATTPVATGLSCGTATVVVSDVNGCQTQGSAPLPCPPALIIDSVLSQPALCFGQNNAQIAVFAHGGVGALIYQWNDPNQQTGPVAQGLIPGSYTVTVRDTNGCTVSQQAEAVQPLPLSLSVGAAPASCFGGANGQAWAVVEGGTPPYVYVWNGVQQTDTISGLTAGVYLAAVTDANNCPQQSASVVVTQPTSALGVVVVSLRRPCANESNGQIEALATGGAGEPYSYLWSDNQIGPLATDLPQGSYTVTVSDALGCTATVSASIAQLDTIVVNVAFVPPPCAGQAGGVAAVNKVSGGVGGGILSNYNYAWSIPNVPNQESVEGLLGGVKYFVTVSDAQGCSGVDSVTLSEPPPILIGLEKKDLSCFGANDGIAGVNFIQNAALPIVSYLWSGNQTTSQIVNLSEGFYSVTLTDSKGCTGSAGIEIVEAPPITLTLEATQILCYGDSSARITATPVGGSPPYNFAWNNGAAMAAISGIGAGDYSVFVTDSKGCSAFAQRQITQPPPPDIQIAVVEPRCHGEPGGVISTSISGATPPYRYALDNGPWVGSSKFTGLRGGDYTLRVADALGCRFAIPVSLPQPLPIVLELPEEYRISLGDSLILSPQWFNTAGDPTFVWQSAYVGDSLRCNDPPDCSEIRVSPITTTVYTLTVRDEKGCTAGIQTRVWVEKNRALYVPSGFSPNGDGANDLLGVLGKSQNVRNIRLFQVFNRWGGLVYEDRNLGVTDPQRGWDGRFNGQDAAPDVYIWLIEAEYTDGFVEILRGETTLIR